MVGLGGEAMRRRLVQTLGRFFGHGSFFFSAIVEGVADGMMTASGVSVVG